MSTKSTLFLTNDNEHCYEECLEQKYDGDKFIGYTVYLELDKRNVEIVAEDKEGWLLKIRAGSELSKYLQLLRNKEVK